MRNSVIEVLGTHGSEVKLLSLPCNLYLQQADTADEGVLQSLFAVARPDAERALFALPGIGSDLLDMQWKARQSGYAVHFSQLVVWLVRTDCGDTIGSLTVSKDDTQVRLVDLVLRPDARGQGIGTCLVQWLQAGAARDALPLHLSVASSSPARRLYDRLGFRILSATATDLEMLWLPPRIRT